MAVVGREPNTGQLNAAGEMGEYRASLPKTPKKDLVPDKNNNNNNKYSTTYLHTNEDRGEENKHTNNYWPISVETNKGGLLAGVG